MKKIVEHAPPGCRRAIIEAVLAEDPVPALDAARDLFCTLIIRPLTVFMADGPAYPGPDVRYAVQTHAPVQKWLYKLAGRGTFVTVCGYLSGEGVLRDARIFPASS